MIKVKKLKPDALLPVIATEGSVGYDLFACLEFSHSILPGQGVLIPCGIAIEPLDGYWAKIESRSSLATKSDLIVKCGVIDPDYRGELKVALHNVGGLRQAIVHGMKIAQFVLYPVSIFPVFEVEELRETKRGAGGFGSTGS